MIMSRCHGVLDWMRPRQEIPWYPVLAFLDFASPGWFWILRHHHQYSCCCYAMFLWHQFWPSIIDCGIATFLTNETIRTFRFPLGPPRSLRLTEPLEGTSTTSLSWDDKRSGPLDIQSATEWHAMGLPNEFCFWLFALILSSSNITYVIVSNWEPDFGANTKKSIKNGKPKKKEPSKSNWLVIFSNTI